MKQWRVKVIKSVSKTGFIIVQANDYSTNSFNEQSSHNLEFYVNYQPVVVLPKGAWLAVEEITNPPYSYVNWGYASIDHV
jgi:hypothetical protein